MKTREEITEMVKEAIDRGNHRAAMFALGAVQLELLCDIRDLLQQPQTININGNLQTPDDFVKAISEAVRRGRL